MDILFCSWFRWNALSFSPFSTMLPIVWCCHVWTWNMLKYVPSMCTFRRFFIINWHWILSKSLMAFIGIVIWFLFFSRFMWYITVIDLWTLKTPCIPWMNPTWSWSKILLMYCLIWIASIFWRFLHLCSPVIWPVIFFFCVCDIFVYFWY